MPNSNTQPEPTTYRVSTNRGKARHRVRYVEGTATDPDECRLCQTPLSAEASGQPATQEGPASEDQS
ncbi:hypothetical protein QQM79_04195 [Marinobacteraceae bacterium S3BR75-40.1]